jgi:hypothetical protein
MDTDGHRWEGIARGIGGIAHVCGFKITETTEAAKSTEK